jgi:hypothetical protein
MTLPAYTFATLTARRPILAKAWDLVCPALHAKRLAERGLITAEQASKVSWKGRIVALVLDSELDAAGVTLEDIAEAVEFYTATEAFISPEMVGYRAGDEDRDVSPRPGHFIQAAGYAAGRAW